MTIVDRRLPDSRKGNVMIFIIFSAVALFMFGAMTINFVSFDLSEEKLQHSADAAAISAAYAIMLKDDAINPQVIADRVANDFLIYSKSQAIGASDIKFGRCAQDAFGKFTFLPDKTPYNAARVNARRGSSHAAGAIPVLFGNILGVSSVNMECVATAIYLEQDIAIVMDASGLMHGPDRYDEAARAFGVILDALEAREQESRVSLTFFSKDGDNIQPLTKNLSDVRNAFATIELKGPRNIESGIIEGMRSLCSASESRNDAAKNVILLSECKDTSGFDAEELGELVRDLGGRIHCLTFSNQADGTIASALSDSSGGEYQHKTTNAQITDFVNRILDDGGVFLCE